MLLTLGGMFLLALLILRMNNSFLTTSDVLLGSKSNVIAISLASSFIEEASSKAFDSKTISKGVTSLTQLSQVDSLGPELYEVRKFFNDFDDYNNFTLVDTFVVDSMILGIYNISCNVDYVLPSAPDVAVSTPTWNKRLRVRVYGEGLNDTIKMSTIYSYWYFR